MNAVFTCLFLLCTLFFCVFSPETYLSALQSGATKGVSACISLLAVYALWLGVGNVMKECGVTEGISRLLQKPVQKLFQIPSGEGCNYVCVNLSANILGLGGVATPYGVMAANSLQKEKNAHFAHNMLLVVNATSLQLFPTTVLSLLAQYESTQSATILLPTLLCTTLTTALGILLCKLFIGGKKKRLC